MARSRPRQYNIILEIAMLGPIGKGLAAATFTPAVRGTLICPDSNPFEAVCRLL